MSRECPLPSVSRIVTHTKLFELFFKTKTLNKRVKPGVLSTGQFAGCLAFNKTPDLPEESVSEELEELSLTSLDELLLDCFLLFLRFSGTMIMAYPHINTGRRGLFFFLTFPGRSKGPLLTGYTTC